MNLSLDCLIDYEVIENPQFAEDWFCVCMSVLCITDN